MRNFLLGFLLGAACLFGALYGHVIRATDGFHYVPKTSMTLRDSYVDIREWDASSWTDHPALAEALAKERRTDLMGAAANKTFSNALDSLLPGRSRKEKSSD